VHHIRLYDNSQSNTKMTAQFILRLKEDFKFLVEMQLPDSVDKAVVPASIYEKLLEKNLEEHHKALQL
jgi:hypothetical protein